MAGTEKFFYVNFIIIAISQGPRAAIANSSLGIKVNPKVFIETSEVGQTSRTGVLFIR